MPAIYSLRTLEGQLQKVLVITTTDIDQDESDTKGKYVWRDSAGEKYF